MTFPGALLEAVEAVFFFLTTTPFSAFFFAAGAGLTAVEPAGFAFAAPTPATDTAGPEPGRGGEVTGGLATTLSRAATALIRA